MSETMRGMVWLQEMAGGLLCGSFTQRFVILWPLCGAQYFAQQPLELDVHRLKASCSPDDGWICGGSISLKSLEKAPMRYHGELALFPIKLSLASAECDSELLIALESEDARAVWATHLSFLIKSLALAQVAQDCDQLPAGPLAETLCSCASSLQLRDIQLNTKQLQVINRYFSLPVAATSLLMHIELANTSLSDSHAFLVNALLTLTPNLASFSIAENYFTSKGVATVSEALALCPTLTLLDLSNNLISDTATDALCKALAHMPELTSLNLSRNRLSSEFVEGLLRRVVNYRTAWEFLDVSYNSLGDALCGVLLLLLQNIPASLMHCDVSFTGMSDASFRVLSEVLPDCASLRTFVAEGCFLEASVLRALFGATIAHQAKHSRTSTDGLVLRVGGVVQDVYLSTGLGWKALKMALTEMQEPAVLGDLALRKQLSAYASSLPIVCFRLCLPQFLSNPRHALGVLSEALGCAPAQLQILSFTSSSAAVVWLAAEQRVSPALSFLMFTILPSCTESGPAALPALVRLIEGSQAVLRMLGVRSVYVQYTKSMLAGVPVSPGEAVVTINQAIRASGTGGRGPHDNLVPAMGSASLYPTDFQYSEWAPEVEDDGPDDDDEQDDGQLSAEIPEGAEDPRGETMSEVFARESKVRDDRLGSERLVLAVRRLHAAKEITSAVAKFWEGILGNRKYRALAELELLQAMKCIPWLPTDATARVQANALLPEELVLLRDAFEGVRLSVFPAISLRQVLYDAMFARDLPRLQVLLKATPAHAGGQAFLLAQKLVGEVVSLTNSFGNVQAVAHKYADLPLVEDFLLQCGRLAYSGAEMYRAVELRQELVVAAVEKGDPRALPDLARIKLKALLSNLLISRDMDTLKAQVQYLRSDGPDATGLAEFQLAEQMVKQHSKVQKLLCEAIEGRGLDQLDAALAQASFHYLYCSEVDEALVVVSDQSRNPAPLLRRIVTGLRNKDMASVERGFDELDHLGIMHPALDTVVCSKIYAIKNRIVQDDAVKDKVVKICLALRNGLSTPSADIAQVYRKALSLGLDKDPAVASYFSVISKHAKKLAGVFKQEQFIADLLERDDVVHLNMLLNGRGTGKLVISFPTAFARDQWYDKLRDVCVGKYGSTGGTVVYTGTFEKAARSNDGVYKGWRRRYFVLSSTHIAYHAKAQGEMKGSMRMISGAVRVISPQEFSPHLGAVPNEGEAKANYSHRLYCLELQEGRDISSISLDLLDEVKKRVRLAKILKIEQLLAHAIAVKSMVVLTKMLAHAQSLEVMLDYKLMTTAKQCLMELKERNLKAELHFAGVFIPKNFVMKDLLELARDYHVDPQLPSVQRVQGLLTKSEVEQDLLRAWRLLTLGDLVGFVRSMRKLTKLDWSQAHLQTHKGLFIDAFLRYVCTASDQLHLAGRSRMGLARVAKKALLLSSANHVESETMDLMRLVNKLDNQQLGSGQRERPAELSRLGNEADGGIAAVGQEEGLSDIQSFVEEIASAASSASQFALNRFPHLRGSADHAKGSTSFSFFSKKPNHRRKAALEILSFTPQPLTKSLLVKDGLDNGLCVDAFAVLQVLMGDHPVTTLPKPGKGKVVKSQGPPEGLLLELLQAMQMQPLLVDECYFQLCKQLTGNDSWASTGKGWVLFCVVLLAFAPSADARPFMQAFVAEHVRTLILQADDAAAAVDSEPTAAPVVAHIQESGEDADSVAAASMAHSSLDAKYSLRAAQYAQFLLSRLADRDAVPEMLPLAPSHQDILPLLSCILEQAPIDVEVVLMTGKVVSIALPFSQLSSPHSLLVKLYEELVPAELRRYYANHDQDSASLNAHSSQHSPVDQQLLNDYDSKFDVDYLINNYSSTKKSGGLSSATCLGDLGEEQMERAALLLFRNFGIFRVDTSAWAARDEPGMAVDLLKLPVQPMVAQFLSWDHNLQFEVLESLAVQRGGPTHHKLERMEGITIRKYVLRNILLSPSTERFSGDYELLGHEFGSFDQSHRLLALRRWLASDSSASASGNAKGVATATAAAAAAAAAQKSEAPPSGLLPLDFQRLDLVFAEETRYVNSRLALLNDDHFHYLLAMQLSITWCCGEAESAAPTGLRVLRCSHGVSPCYARLPMQTIRRYNDHKERQLANVRDSLHLSDRRQAGNESSDESCDSDEGADAADPQQLQRLQRKYDQVHHALSKFSPRRTLQRKVYQRTAEVKDVNLDDAYASADDDGSSDGGNEHDDFMQLKGTWRPRPVQVEQPLSADDLHHLRGLLDDLGVPKDADGPADGAATRVDVLWAYLGAFHKAARDAGVTPDSAYFRYVVKRAYHDYLTSITSYCGLHFAEGTLQALTLQASLKFESAELTAHVNAFRGPAPVLLALSLYGVYLCDPASWAVLFHAPLFDVQQCEVLADLPQRNAGRASVVEPPVVLRLLVNGLQIDLTCSRREAENVVQMLSICARQALVTLDLHDASADADESAALRGLDDGADCALFRALYARVYSSSAAPDAHQRLVQRFLCRYCPLLPAPSSIEALPLRSGADRFQPLKSKREVVLQQRLESLWRDQALSSLATHARYEKSQEHMHSHSNRITTINQKDDDDEDGDAAPDGSAPASAHARSSRRKRPVARSVFRDPHVAAQAGAQDRDKALSAIVGTVHPQVNRFVAHKQSATMAGSLHGSVYQQQHAVSEDFSHLPVRVRGAVHVPSRPASSGAEVGRRKPELRTPLSLPARYGSVAMHISSCAVPKSQASVTAVGAEDLSQLLPVLEAQLLLTKSTYQQAHERHVTELGAARARLDDNALQARDTGYVLGLNR